MSTWLHFFRISFNEVPCLRQTCFSFWISFSLLPGQLGKEKVTQIETSYAPQKHSSTKHSCALTVFHRKLHSVLKRRQTVKCRFAKTHWIQRSIQSISIQPLLPQSLAQGCPDAELMRLVRLLGKGFACLCVFLAVWDKLTFLSVSWWLEQLLFSCTNKSLIYIMGTIQVFLLDTSLPWHALGKFSTTCVSTAFIL